MFLPKKLKTKITPPFSHTNFFPPRHSYFCRAFAAASPRALCKLKPESGRRHPPPESRAESSLKHMKRVVSGRARAKRKTKGRQRRRVFVPSEIQLAPSLGLGSFLLSRTRVGIDSGVGSVGKVRTRPKKRTDGRNAEADGSEKEKRRKDLCLKDR